MRYLYLLLLLLGGHLVFGQNPEGLWKTIDEETGEVKSYVEIFDSNGSYYGRIKEVVQDNYIKVCRECPGDKHNQPVENLVIIEGVKSSRSSNKWRGGTVLDPETGKTFRFSMWFEAGKFDEMKVRGKHWTGVYRTQTWQRATKVALH